MHIIVLGGVNDKYELDNFTKLRVKKAIELVKKNDKKYILHFSGGYRWCSDFSQAKVCKQFFLKTNNHIENDSIRIILHENNNHTVDEAINFGFYLKDKTEPSIIITNDWHYERVKYLFTIVFQCYKITNYEIIGVESGSCGSYLVDNEKKKLQQLKNNPYDKWKNWLVNNDC